MQKRGLRDVKRRNRHVIIQSVLDSGLLSRVEIAQKTGLAPSTVSTLVAELLEQGLLTEGGSQVTAGRSRTELMLNPNYGCIAVVEVGRSGVGVSLFDMALDLLEHSTLSASYLSGNELLDAIIKAAAPFRTESRPLAGIGLLFQEDMRESDFRVMYSTGFASASITLKEALISEFRIPVFEDYAQIYTVKDALGERKQVNNSAQITLGERVVVAVTQQDQPVPIRSDFFESGTRCLEDLVPEDADAEKLGILVALLCSLFLIQNVFLSCGDGLREQLGSRLQEQLRKRLPPERVPEVHLLMRRQTERCAVLYARRLRSDILFNRG